MSFKENWVAGDSSHIAEHRQIGAYLNDSIAVITNYGAKGDGVTDDTAAIQAAIDSGKDVLIPPGIYKTDSLNLTKCEGTIIRGANRWKSILLLHTDGKQGLDMMGSHHIILEDFTLRGDTTGSPNVGIFMARSTTSHGGGCHLNRLVFDGTYTLGMIANHNMECCGYHGIRMAPTPNTNLRFGFYFSDDNTWSIPDLFAVNLNL